MVSAAPVSRQERIIPLYREADYLSARGIATGRETKLPSNVLHDEYLTSDRWRTLGAHYPAWAWELVAYPEKGGRFRIGSDIKSSENDWILPADYVPREAVGRERVGLFIDAHHFTKEKGKLVVHPGFIRVLCPFIQENGKGGKMDRSTGIPLDVDTSLKGEKRYLCRSDNITIAPIARFVFGHMISENHIFAKNIADESLGVCGVSYF